MIWGVGTGRCGTKSLAMALKGAHEPQPWLADLPIKHYHEKIGVGEKSYLRQLIRERAESDEALISDWKQSYILPMIEEVDPQAKYVFLIRNPLDCISSFLAGGAFTTRDKQGKDKMTPAEGWGSNVGRLDKVLYHYLMTNKVIGDFLVSLDDYSRWDIIPTDRLPVVANKYPEKYECTVGEEVLIASASYDMYANQLNMLGSHRYLDRDTAVIPKNWVKPDPEE